MMFPVPPRGGGLYGSLADLASAMGREFRKVHSVLERIETNTSPGQADTLARVRALVDQWATSNAHDNTLESAVIREAAKAMYEVLDGTPTDGGN